MNRITPLNIWTDCLCIQNWIFFCFCVSVENFLWTEICNFRRKCWISICTSIYLNLNVMLFSQGLFIFLMNCVRQKKVFDMWWKPLVTCVTCKQNKGRSRDNSTTLTERIPLKQARTTEETVHSVKWRLKMI